MFLKVWCRQWTLTLGSWQQISGHLSCWANNKMHFEIETLPKNMAMLICCEFDETYFVCLCDTGYDIVCPNTTPVMYTYCVCNGGAGSWGAASLLCCFSGYWGRGNAWCWLWHRNDWCRLQNPYQLYRINMINVQLQKNNTLNNKRPMGHIAHLSHIGLYSKIFPITSFVP